MTRENRRLAYIAKDTKTYMNLEEARFSYANEGDQNTLFVIIPKENDNEMKRRVRETITDELWDEVVWIDSWSNGISPEQKVKKKRNKVYSFLYDLREFGFNFLDKRKLNSIASSYRSFDIVFSAHKNTQEHLAWALNPSKLVIVDSGHRIFERINKDGYIDYSRWYIVHSRFTRYMYWLTGLKVFNRKKTILFTAYADDVKTKHAVEKNNYNYQGYQLKSKEPGDKVIWISTPIYAMVDGVELEDYVSYINDYISHLKIDREKLVYIPHPGKQTQSEIEFIQRSLECSIDDRDTPVEFKIANYKKLPEVCLSPFSSALVNLNMASEGNLKLVSAWHYEFDYFRIWHDWKIEVLKNEKLNIEFIELPDCHPLFNIEDTDENKQPMFENFKDWRIKKLEEQKKKH